MPPMTTPTIAPTEVKGACCVSGEGVDVGAVERLVDAEDGLERIIDAEDLFEDTIVFGSFSQYQHISTASPRHTRTYQRPP